ncbi:MAG: VOC family protein [Actinomycetota bacterium]|nr:VOC family protein [Actinomycetota bacterium]
MSIQLNHTIVPARNGEVSARWFSELFGMPAPTAFGPFWQVTTANGVDLDFDTYGDENSPFTFQHYAFLVGEDDFDIIYGRICDRRLDHWADPARSKAGEINDHDGGRGVYFPSNDDHLLEIITRPYGG